MTKKSRLIALVGVVAGQGGEHGTRLAVLGAEHDAAALFGKGRSDVLDHDAPGLPSSIRIIPEVLAQVFVRAVAEDGDDQAALAARFEVARPGASPRAGCRPTRRR